MAKDDNKEEYDGDYKVVLSDEGRVTFNLNWKWLVGILITVMGFVGYLLVDEYYIEPMALKDSKIEALETDAKDKTTKIDILLKNQGILLERSELTQKFITFWIESGQLNPSGGNEPALESPLAAPGINNIPTNAPDGPDED